MKPLRLHTRLTIQFTLILAGLLLLLSGMAYQVLSRRLEESIRTDLRQRSAGLRGYLNFEDGRPKLVFDPDDPDEAYFIRTATRHYQVFDLSSGALLVQSRELEILGVESTPEEVRALGREPFVLRLLAPGMFLFHNEVIRDGGRLYLLQVGSPLDAVHRPLNEWLWMTAIVVPLGVLIAGIASWWMAGRALQPVQDLNEAAREIGISDLHRRLPVRGTGDELDELSKTFNRTFANLEKAVGEMRQFTASISHELRTPMTALRGEAEVMLLQERSVQDYKRLIASHLEEYEKLTRVINQLLILARAEAGEIGMNPASVDIAELAASLVDQLETIAESKKVDLQMHGGTAVFVRVDPDWVSSIILNLLDNALKFTPAGGVVTVSVSAEDQWGCLEVRDTGVGIPADSLPHIFERFFRADPSRNAEIEGAGLGLSLVQWLVEQHGGRIEVASEPGNGSCFTVRLPRAPILP